MISSPEISLTALEQLASGPLTRIFEGAVAAWPGAVLFVPLALIHGDLTRLIDQCPCPFEDVLECVDKLKAVPLEEVQGGVRFLPDSLAEQLRALVPGDWFYGAGNSMKVRVLVSRHNVRLALTQDLIRSARPIDEGLCT